MLYLCFLPGWEKGRAGSVACCFWVSCDRWCSKSILFYLFLSTTFCFSFAVIADNYSFSERILCVFVFVWLCMCEKTLNNTTTTPHLHHPNSSIIYHNNFRTSFSIYTLFLQCIKFYLCLYGNGHYFPLRFLSCFVTSIVGDR